MVSAPTTRPRRRRAASCIHALVAWLVLAGSLSLVAATAEAAEPTNPPVEEPSTASIVRPATDNAVRRALEDEPGQSYEPSEPTVADDQAGADPVSPPATESAARRAVEAERAATGEAPLALEPEIIPALPEPGTEAALPESAETVRPAEDRERQSGGSASTVPGTAASKPPETPGSTALGEPADQDAPRADGTTALDAASAPDTPSATEPQAPVIALDQLHVDESDDEKAAARESAMREEHADLTDQRERLEDIEEEAADDATTSAELPEPCTGPWDWAHLSSGEWLRGEFKRMRKRRFEMRSTRFNLQTTDWKHIRGFCFPGNTRFILDDHTVMTGRGRLENGVLTVVSGNVTQSAPRDDVWVILPGLAQERNRWRATLSAGLDTYTGNTDQKSATAAASIDREDASSHLSLTYDGSFGAADGNTNVARHRATQSMNVYFTRLFYATLPFVDYTSDRFQNLQHRAATGLSLGLKFFDLETFEWSVDAGIAYQYSQYREVLPGQAIRENDWGPRLSTSLEWDIVTDLTLNADHQTVIMTRDFGQTNYHTQIALSYEITDLIYLELAYWHDRVRDPQQATVDYTPDPDDFRYVVSIGLNFD